MLIDTHSHLNLAAYDKDRGEVIGKTLAENVWMINVGTKYETSKAAVELAEKYSQGIYAAIGLYPSHASAEIQKVKSDSEEGEFLAAETNFDKEKYGELAKSKKVVAVGEVGLDYYYKPRTSAKLEQFKEKQKKVFIEQLDFAKEFNLPVILHCRMAHEDILEILERRKGDRGTIHCFTGNLEQAQRYMNADFYIGVNGIIFKMDLDEVIKQVPLNKILIETDCPYLTPLKAGPKETRNEPLFVKYVAERIAELKNISFGEVASATTENAKKVFKI